MCVALSCLLVVRSFARMHRNRPINSSAHTCNVDVRQTANQTSGIQNPDPNLCFSVAGTDLNTFPFSFAAAFDRNDHAYLYVHICTRTPLTTMQVMQVLHHFQHTFNAPFPCNALHFATISTMFLRSTSSSRVDAPVARHIVVFRFLLLALFYTYFFFALQLIACRHRTQNKMYSIISSKCSIWHVNFCHVRIWESVRFADSYCVLMHGWHCVRNL